MARRRSNRNEDSPRTTSSDRLRASSCRRANSIDPDLQESEATTKSCSRFSARWRTTCRSTSTGSSAGSTTRPTNQNCYGIPCDRGRVHRLHAERASSPMPGRTTCSAPATTGQVTVLRRAGRNTSGKDTFFHTNCGNNVLVSAARSATSALELSISKRMSNRWQMQGSYVWSRLDGDQSVSAPTSTTTSARIRLHEPEQSAPLYGSRAVGANDQPHAFKVLGSYQAPLGHHRRRQLPGAERPAARSQPERAVRIRAPPTHPRRAARRPIAPTTLNLLSLRARQDASTSARGHRASVDRRAAQRAELRSAGQNSYGISHPRRSPVAGGIR